MDELRRIYVERAMAEIDRTMAEMADSHLNALATILLPPSGIIPEIRDPCLLSSWGKALQAAKSKPAIEAKTLMTKNDSEAVRVGRVRQLWNARPYAERTGTQVLMFLPLAGKALSRFAQTWRG